ncbi:MAG: hypothetical protein HY816_11710 [Candidatus Wallbacteria bacterium]|nr:hypothetical protein [Candidatus Wallbacteria bacterium]
MTHSTMSSRVWLPVLLVSSLLTPHSSLLWSAETAGVYVDGSGARHPWRIDSNDMLHWRGQPFVPVGGMFCFRYLSEFEERDVPGNEARWKGDLEILDRVERAGIRHLYVNPVNPATRFGASVWNHCLEELERRRFEYGIELTDGPERGMDGYLLGGVGWGWSVARAGGSTAASVRLTWEMEFGQLPRAIELLAVTPDGRAGRISLPSTRAATLVAGLPAWAAHPQTRFIPRVEAPKGFNVPDLWGGYGEYERRLLRLLSGLKLGPGLRFILDPFTNEMNYHGLTAHMLPAASEFREELEKWLRAKYKGRRLTAWRAWGGRGRAPEWAVMARLLPVPARPQFVDPETALVLPADCAKSGALEDLRMFRDASVGRFVSRLSERLRRDVADVPIVLKHTGRFARYMVCSTVDGIGIEAWGHDKAALARTAGPPFALLRHRERLAPRGSGAARPTGWLPVTETAPDPSPHGLPPGYPSREAMFSHLDALLGLGARGFYLFALRPLPEELLPDFCLYQDPRQLAWIAEYQRGLGRAPRAALLSTRPPFRFRDAQAGPGLRVSGWKTGRSPALAPVELQGALMVLPRYRLSDR